MADSLNTPPTYTAPTQNQFIHVRDFYNWVKQGTGENSPVSWRYFSVNFYPYEYDTGNVDGINKNFFVDNSSLNPYGQEANIFKSFFTTNMENLNNLRYHIQQIQMPKILYVTSSGESASSPENLASLLGRFSGVKNSYLGVDKQILTMQLLDTQRPIHEHFIYSWMKECMRNNVSNENSPIPRVNMSVKYWRPDQMANYQEGLTKPEYIYFFRGLFPMTMDLSKAIQARGGDDNNRQVDFAFNEMIITDSLESLFVSKSDNQPTTNLA